MGFHYVEEAGLQVGLISPSPNSKYSEHRLQPPCQATVSFVCSYFTVLPRTGAHLWKPLFSWEVQGAFSSSPGAAQSQFRVRTESKACLRRVNWFQKYPFEPQVVLTYNLFLYALWRTVLTRCRFNSVNTMFNNHHFYASNISFTENYLFPFRKT